MASRGWGVLVSWFATVIWNRVSRILPVSLAGQLVVFETLSSLLYAAIADRKVPPTYEVAAMSIVVLGVILAVRTSSGAEMMRESGDESSGSPNALSVVEVGGSA
jgi:drug/metabolite transporter (DMT)-like permease